MFCFLFFYFGKKTTDYGNFFWEHNFFKNKKFKVFHCFSNFEQRFPVPWRLVFAWLRKVNLRNHRNFLRTILFPEKKSEFQFYFKSCQKFLRNIAGKCCECWRNCKLSFQRNFLRFRTFFGEPQKVLIIFGLLT